MPRNSLVNGKPAPDSFDTQLDETAYPILMAYQLGMTDASLYRDHIKPAAYFLVATAPRSAPSAGRSRAASRRRRSRPRSPASSPRPTSPTSTATSESAARLARGRRRLPALDQGLDGDDERAASPRRTSSASRRPATRTPRSRYNVGNGGPTLDQRVGDRRRLPRALAPRRAPGRATRTSLQSLPVVDATIKIGHRQRAGLAPLQRRRLRRRRERRPPVGADRPGHRPPLAGALRGARRARRSRPAIAPGAAALLDAMARFASRRRADPRAGLGSSPTSPRSPFGTDPTLASIGFANGEPAGSASPLTWSAGSYVRLIADLAAGRIARAAGQHLRPLRRPHAGADEPDCHEPGRPVGGHGSPVDVSRHDRARQHDRRRRDEHRHRLADDDRPRRRPRRTARSRVRAGHGRHDSDQRRGRLA